jgi:hypothetical protein
LDIDVQQGIAGIVATLQNVGLSEEEIAKIRPAADGERSCNAQEERGMT